MASIRARGTQTATLVSGAERLIQGVVHELVRALVRFAPDIAHGPAIEPAQRLHRLEEKRLEAGVLDLVHAVDLARHELRVVDHLDLARTELASQLQAEE